MRIEPIRLPRVSVGTNVFELVFKQLHRRKLHEGIIVIASKIVSYDQGRIIPVSRVSSSRSLKTFAQRYGIPVGRMHYIKKEADEILGGVRGAVLTENEGILIANAGIDTSNVPKGNIALWPEKPWQWADQMRHALDPQRRKKIGVLISDSHCTPRRSGTTGVALAIAGFHGVIDKRGTRDLYGNRLKMTRINIADDLASAAHTLQGEGDEQIPVAIIHDSPARFARVSAHRLTKALQIPRRRDLFQYHHDRSSIR